MGLSQRLQTGGKMVVSSVASQGAKERTRGPKGELRVALASPARFHN